MVLMALVLVGAVVAVLLVFWGAALWGPHRDR